MSEKIANKRYELFMRYKGYDEKNYNNKDIMMNTEYIFFTTDREEEYLKEKRIEHIYDFRDFDNYCINWLKKQLGEEIV